MHDISQGVRFTKIPKVLFEALIQRKLSGTQLRVILWVIQHTFGWHRQWVSFTWYRIAEDLDVDRAAVYRAGCALLKEGVLVEHVGLLAVQMHLAVWDRGPGLLKPRDSAQQLWISSRGVAQEQRGALSPGNDSVVQEQRFSDELKTLKTKDKRRSRGCGHVHNPPDESQTIPVLDGGIRIREKEDV